MSLSHGRTSLARKTFERDVLHRRQPLRRIIAVPKTEIERQDVKYQRKRRTASVLSPVKRSRYVFKAQLRSTLTAKSGNRSRLTRSLPPKDLARKVSRRLLMIQALVTRFSVGHT